MSDLPNGWVVAPLGQIASTQLGKMLSKKAKAGVRPLPYLRNKNVQWGRIDIDDVAAMDFSDEEFERFALRSGDLLVCEGGEVGRAAIWRGQIEKIGFQKALHRVRPFGGIVPEFLFHQLRWLAQTDAFEALVTGSTIKHLPQEDFRTLPMAVPSVAEQRRIVAAIEEHFSRLDAAEGALADAERRRRALERVVLAQLTTRPAAHWPIVSVNDVGRVQLGRQRSPKHHHGPGMRPYLRVANVFEDRIDVSDVKEMAFTPQEAVRYELHAGDILLNEGQSPHLVGRPAMYRGELPGGCFTNSLIRFQAGPDVEPAFALLVFRSHLHSGRFQREAQITTNIAHMAAGRFKTVEFPLPSIEEQGRIVSLFEERLSRIDALGAALRAARLRGTALRRSVLERAFRGELVPQDPSDEPASVLLERIRAERASDEGPRRTRRGEASSPA